MSSDSAGAGPASSAGMLEVFIWTASIASGAVSSPIIRFTHPWRSEEPGAASSISSIAAKCERFGVGRPTACTAAISPRCHNQARADRSGCRPNIASGSTRLVEGTAIRGRAV